MEQPVIIAHPTESGVSSPLPLKQCDPLLNSSL